MSQRGRPRNFDRAAALKNAMHAFWKCGYEGASFAVLKEAMALNAPSIYAAFGSKNELFNQAVDLYLSGDGAAIPRAMDEAITATEAAEAFLHTSAEEFARTDRPQGCLIVLEALHDRAGNDAVRRQFRRLRGDSIERLSARFEQGVAEGELPADRDWDSIATYLVAVQHGMAVQARDGASQKTLQAIADCALAVLQQPSPPHDPPNDFPG